MLVSIIHNKILDINKGEIKYERFTMIPNGLIKSAELNDAEKILIMYYHSHTGKDNEYSAWYFNDKTVLKELGWSEGKLKRTKASLKEKDMLYIQQATFDKYNYYVGKEAVKRIKASLSNEV